MTAVLASLGLDPNALLTSVGTVGLFAVIFAETGLMIGFFLPGDSLLFTAGLLAATTGLLWPFPALLAGCALAAILGDQVGYTFGHRVGRPLFNRPSSRLFKREHLLQAEEFFERHGSKTIVLARFVPLVRTFAPIVAGTSRMRRSTFTAYNVVGGIAWTWLMLGLGYVLGTRFPGIGNYLDVAIVVIVVISLVPVGIEYLRHRRRNRSARLEAAPVVAGAASPDLAGPGAMVAAGDGVVADRVAGSVATIVDESGPDGAGPGAGDPDEHDDVLAALLAGTAAAASTGGAGDGSGAGDGGRKGRRRRRKDRPVDPARRQRRRRIEFASGLVVVALLVVPASSFVSALRAPGNMSTTEKSVEWLRDHGMGGLVNQVENWWFGHNAPKTGGEPTRAIAAPAPTVTSPVTTVRVVPHTPPPANIATPAGSSLPNEGVWQPVGPVVGGQAAMYTTQIRPDAVHTSLLEGLVWMDPKLLSFQVHPGLQEPGGKWTTPPEVPMDQRLSLVAAFNGGFRMGDANGGFYLEGREQKPLVDGAASFVVRADGTATVGEWGRDVTMGPDVVAVRQNLKLIVDGGQPVLGLNDNANGAWGATLGNRVLVWRSGVCVEPNGGVIYGYGPGLGALSLAQMFQRAGCQRAMELDINPSWTSFNFYSAKTFGDPASVTGTPLLPGQNKGGNRYLSPDSRDFVAVLARPL